MAFNRFDIACVSLWTTRTQQQNERKLFVNVNRDLCAEAGFPAGYDEPMLTDYAREKVSLSLTTYPWKSCM